MDRKALESLGRRERKKLEVRRRIRRAAAQLFAEKGYEAATVDEITTLADVAKGTFFNHFPRKDALLLELAEDLLESLEEELGPPESWRGSRRAQLLRLFLYMGERVHGDPKLFKVMIVETTRNLWMRGEDDLGHEVRELSERLLTEGIEVGEFESGADVEVATRLLEAAYVTATIESLRSETSFDAYREELTRRFEIIFRGLGGGPIEEEGSGG